MLRMASRTTPSGASAARERLLRTASDLFYREGIHAVGVDRIIAEAGVTRATFYRHFPSKEDLVEAYLGVEDATIRGAFDPGARGDRRAARTPRPRDRGARRRRRAPAHPRMPLHQRGGRVSRSRERGALRPSATTANGSAANSSSCSPRRGGHRRPDDAAGQLVLAPRRRDGRRLPRRMGPGTAGVRGTAATRTAGASVPDASRTPRAIDGGPPSVDSRSGALVDRRATCGA